MKIKIDTVAKTIQLEQSAKLTDLFSLIKKLLPNDEWKQYSLEAVQVFTYWSEPIYIPSVWNPNFKQDKFEITCTGTNETYCIETN